MAKAEAGAAADVDDDDYVETMKPGQKEPTPSPGNADRVFYETLLEQIPSSHMAKEYCLRFGILTFDRALKVYKELYGEAYKEGSKPRPSPTKPKPSPAPAASKAKAAEAKKPAGKKRKAADDDDGGDTGFEAGADWEGAGTAGF